MCSCWCANYALHIIFAKSPYKLSVRNVMTCFSIISKREKATDLICLSHAGALLSQSLFLVSAIFGMRSKCEGDCQNNISMHPNLNSHTIKFHPQTEKLYLASCNIITGIYHVLVLLMRFHLIDHT